MHPPVHPPCPFRLTTLFLHTITLCVGTQRFGKELLPFADDLNTYPSIVHFIGPATIPPPAVTAFGGGGAYIGKPYGSESRDGWWLVAATLVHVARTLA